MSFGDLNPKPRRKSPLSYSVLHTLASAVRSVDRLRSGKRQNLTMSQPQSWFCTKLPLELCNAIYAFLLGSKLHLSRHHGRFYLLGCVGADGNRKSYRSDDKKLPSGASAAIRAGYRLCARRLMSPWGLHWKCEEDMLLSLGQQNSSYLLDSGYILMLLVCKQM